jgi:hypothetical protein
MVFSFRIFKQMGSAAYDRTGQPVLILSFPGPASLRKAESPGGIDANHAEIPRKKGIPETQDAEWEMRGGRKY